MNTKHLKAKILDLAIRGKLVPQNLSEGNASDLLKKIREEKGGESLPLAPERKHSSATPSADSNAARNARSKNSTFIIKASDGRHYEGFADGTLKDIEDEIPFELPENWCWTSLEEISISIIAGGDRPAVWSPEKTESNCIPIYANAIAKDGLYGYTNKPQITDKAITISARGTIGFTCIREEPFVPIVRLITLVPNLELIDLKYLKSSFDVLLNMTEDSSIPQLTIPTIKTFIFPLPPLAEQQRIVCAIEKSLGE
jgi:type I restriction enzyme, S subunit